MRVMAFSNSTAGQMEARAQLLVAIPFLAQAVQHVGNS